MTSKKEGYVGFLGSLSGGASILGSWQICHNACLGLIALLSIIGITLTGMPLVFFTKIVVPMWLTAVGLLLVVLYFYFSRHCISRNLILINTGLIVAGTPDKFVGSFQPLFWVAGGLVSLSGIGLYIKDKIAKKRVMLT